MAEASVWLMVALSADRAARLYEAALGAIPTDDDRRRDIEERRARALVNAGQCADGALAFLAAAELAAPLEARDLRREAAEMLVKRG